MPKITNPAKIAARALAAKARSFQTILRNDIPKGSHHMDTSEVEAAIIAADADVGRAVIFFNDEGNARMAASRRAHIAHALEVLNKKDKYLAATRNGKVYFWKA